MTSGLKGVFRPGVKCHGFLEEKVPRVSYTPLYSLLCARKEE